MEKIHKKNAEQIIFQKSSINSKTIEKSYWEERKMKKNFCKTIVIFKNGNEKF